ncbi:MAG: sortase [Anaerolineae bacterium]
MKSKFSLGIACVVMIAVALTGCGRPTPAPTTAPTAAPTTAPTTMETRPGATDTPVPQITAAPTATAGAEALTPPVPVTPLTESVQATRLVIPALALDVPVTEVGWRIVTAADGQRTTEWEIADNAAGHHINSAAPGTVGNVVVSGHNNIKGKVFEAISLDVDRPTPRLTPGSDVELYTSNGRHLIYRVTKIDLVPETGAPLAQRLANARYLEQTPDATLTLITCWPSFGNTHRVIVIAKLAVVL